MLISSGSTGMTNVPFVRVQSYKSTLLHCHKTSVLVKIHIAVEYAIAFVSISKHDVRTSFFLFSMLENTFYVDLFEV